jgi:hypothetical protein
VKRDEYDAIRLRTGYGENEEVCLAPLSVTRKICPAFAQTRQPSRRAGGVQGANNALTDNRSTDSAVPVAQGMFA